MIKDNMRPIHPGEILREKFFVTGEDNLTGAERKTKFLLETNFDSNKLQALLNEEINLTKDMIEVIAKFFGCTEEFLLNMQSNYDKKINTLNKLKTIQHWAYLSSK